MPEHSNWLTVLLEHFRSTLEHNAHHLGQSFVGKQEPTWQSWQPLIAALVVFVLLFLIAGSVRARLSDTDKAVIPEDKLTLRTFIETFLGYFYDLCKSVMGPERAKKYFHVVAGSALFVFVSNVLALIPGAPVATSNLNITFGCAAVVFLLFNLYGLQTNGMAYIKHLAGPKWWLAPLIFPIEIISLCVRPVTLSVRLMMNMSVDHIVLGTFMGLIAVVVPLPVMLLGVLVIVIQTLVFSLLTAIYIGLATEHEEH
ncbi:MAG: F0F1 ATP synthase subunit A [Polyangiaceae bacterium]